MTLLDWWSAWEVKGLWHKGIKSRITAIFVIFLKHIFLKITVSISLKVVNRPNKKFVLVVTFQIVFLQLFVTKESFIFSN